MNLRDLAPAPREKTNINVAPLIDIVFILLIFFMVTTTFIRNIEMDIERPSASSAQSSSSPAIRVSVSQTGKVSVDGKTIQPWMVQAHVRDRLSYYTAKRVLVVADGELATQRLIDVVDQCKLAGATDVGVSVQGS